MRPFLLISALTLAGLTGPPASGQSPVPGPIDPAKVAAATACDVSDLPSPHPLTHAEALTAFPNRARADGRILRVGRFTFREPAGQSGLDERAYSYAGPYGEMSMDLVLFNDFDAVGWILLDQRSGKRLDLAALPLPAPDGRRFLFLHPWTTADGGKLEIRERGPRGWRRLAAIPASRACDIRWLEDGAVSYRERGEYSTYVGGPEKTWRP